MLNKLDPRGSGVEGSAEGALAPPLFDEETSQDIDITGGIDNRQWPVGQINKSSLVNYMSIGLWIGWKHIVTFQEEL